MHDRQTLFDVGVAHNLSDTVPFHLRSCVNNLLFWLKILLSSLKITFCLRGGVP